MPLTPPSTVAGFPDAKSTGLPDGVILTASGDVNVTKAGTVINALDVKGHDLDHGPITSQFRIAA